MKYFISGFFLSFFLLGCHQNNHEKPSKTPIKKQVELSTISDSTTFTTTPQTQKYIGFENPALLATGSSLGNLLKAYYLTGQFQKMLPFIILKNGDKSKFLSKIATFQWGYPIKLTNCEWANKKFTLYYNITINNTKKLEIYRGILVNDTAKLYFDCASENPFTGQ